jgi:hypothetical protein
MLPGLDTYLRSHVTVYFSRSYGLHLGQRVIAGVHYAESITLAVHLDDTSDRALTGRSHHPGQRSSGA